MASSLALAGSSAEVEKSRPSKTSDTEVVNKANAFMSGRGGAGAAAEMFNQTGPEAPMPPSMNVAPPSASAKEELDRRENWTLLTPAEIMGVPTPEKIMKLPDSKGEEKMSPEEKFLNRLQRERTGTSSALNALRPQDARALWEGRNSNAKGRHEGRGGADKSSADSSPEKERETSRAPFTSPAQSPLLPNGLPDVNALKPDSPWASTFNQASPWNNGLPQPALSTEPAESMEHFRALMDSSPQPVKPAANAGFFSIQNPAPPPTPIPSPSFNLPGRSYEPMSQNINHPQGVPSLPGLTGSPFAAPAPPSTQAQLPPWMRSASPTFGAPQRKF